MKPIKYTFKQTNKIDLGTKEIYKYPTPTELFDIAKMVVNGRHPKEKGKFILEHACNFVIYVIKGKGTIYAGDEKFTVEPEDVVFVPTENKFAVEGQLEYITIDIPAFYLEQSEEINE
jgi:mannose-6-phosphate isomerase-like protein (cupin superfamily)